MKIPSFRNGFSPLSPYFFAMKLRQQILLVLFGIMAAILWTGLFIKRFDQANVQLRSAKTKLAAQQIWLDHASEIDTRLGKALEHLSPEHTFSAIQLVAKIDSIVRQIGLRAELAKPQSNTAETFELHVLDLDIKQATLEQLIEFDKQLEALFPYISISDIRLSPTLQNPNQIDARAQIASFELRSSSK